MNKLLLAFFALGASTFLAHADSASKIAYGELRHADGDVVVLMSGATDQQSVDAMLAALSQSKADNIRIGLSDAVDGYSKFRATVSKWAEAAPERHFCKGWLTSKETFGGTGLGLISEINERYEGSLIVLDNGANDASRFHPAIGEDPIGGMKDNRVIVGLTAAAQNGRVISDPDLYRMGWELGTYGMTQGVDPEGC